MAKILNQRYFKMVDSEPETISSISDNSCGGGLTINGTNLDNVQYVIITHTGGGPTVAQGPFSTQTPTLIALSHPDIAGRTVSAVTVRDTDGYETTLSGQAVVIQPSVDADSVDSTAANTFTITGTGLNNVGTVNATFTGAGVKSYLSGTYTVQNATTITITDATVAGDTLTDVSVLDPCNNSSSLNGQSVVIDS